MADVPEVVAEAASDLLLARGGAPDDAIFQWRFPFWYHWGKHATDALRALYLEANPDKDL
jgi:hypothetical protein